MAGHHLTRPVADVGYAAVTWSEKNFGQAYVWPPEQSGLDRQGEKMSKAEAAVSAHERGLKTSFLLNKNSK